MSSSQSRWIRLSQSEIDSAIAVGKLRSNVHIASGRPNPSRVLSRLDADSQGAIGELAFARFSGLEWDGRFFDDTEWQRWRVSGGDVSGYEVRATTHKTGRLILHPKDADDKVFVLVRLAVLPLVELAGWTRGSEGKLDAYWHDVGYGKPCFYLPNHQLKSMETLPRRSGQPDPFVVAQRA